MQPNLHLMQQQRMSSSHERLQPKPPFNLKQITTETAQRTLEQYELRDKAYQDILDLQYKRHVEIAQEKKKVIEKANTERRMRGQNPASVFGPGYQFGIKTGFQSKIRYPTEKKRRQVRFNL
ncbi:hypothetical protein G6F56_010029 [Rhizopus delemar]|nr:hypothetical protein G6F56_010029 [Rhizopus delemar]